MYARMVSLITLPDKHSELQKVMERKIGPMLQLQQGLLEFLTFVSDQEPRLVIVITVWSDTSTAENFDQQLLPTIVEQLKPLLQTEPRLMTFEAFSSKSRVPPVAIPASTKSPGRRKGTQHRPEERA